MTRPGLQAFADDPQPILLTLGGFDLVGEGPTWLCEALADGTDLAGNPVPVEVAIQTLIQDGSVSYTEKYDNATIPIRVCLSGPDAEALDDGAAALFAELGKPNVLTYVGPQASQPIAWDVVNSHLERNSDDMAEVKGERYYTVVLSVLPFRRATVETITPALPTGSTTTSVNNGSSATGWTGTINGVSIAPTTAIEAGAVYVYWANPPVAEGWSLTLSLAGPVDTSTLKYIAVDWRVFVNATVMPFTLSATVSGQPLPLRRVAQLAVPSGYMRTWFEVPAGLSSLPQITFQALGDFAIPSGDWFIMFGIDKVDKTNVAPTLGPGQQTLRAIDIEGSARTPGAIAIEHATASLGDVAAFFWTDDGTGYAPSCSPYHVSGAGLSADGAAITGNHENINGVASVFDIPAVRVPRDGYLLSARIGGTASGTVTWTITTRVNGVDLGPTITGSRALTVSGFGLYALDAIQLPTRDLDEAAAGAVVRVSLIGTADFALDEVLLYRDSGQLVQVACGTGSPAAGGSSNRLFIEPPNLSRPRPVVRRGHAADRSDSFHPPGLGAWESPEFKPPRVLVHVITSNTTGAAVSFRHFERLAG